MSDYWLLAGIVGVLGLVMAAGSSLSARTYRFRDGMVQGVIGVMGSGKSLFVVAKVLIPAARALHSRRGLQSSTMRPVRRIITNFNCDTGYDGVEVVVLDGNRLWDHLVELTNTFAYEQVDKHTGETYKRQALDALVVIDECHLYLPASKVKVAQKAAWVCSMARKLNAEIWWITQNEMKVHKRLRDDSSLIWRVGRHVPVWALVTGPSKWFVAKAFEPERMSSLKATPIDRRFYRMSRRVLRAYDSFELIVPDAEADVSRDSLSGRHSLGAVRERNEQAVMHPQTPWRVPTQSEAVGADSDGSATWPDERPMSADDIAPIV